MWRRNWASSTAAAGACAVALCAGSAFADLRWGAGYFPNVPLVTHEGATVRFYDDLLKGKAVAINVIYTTCHDVCPLETARLLQVQRLMGDRMGKDVFFYSISIDPTRDTPQALKAYAEKFHVGPGWLFLTGREDNIRLVVQKLGLSRERDAANPDGHSPSLMIGNEPTGQWMRNSAVDNPRFLAATLSNFLGRWSGRGPEKSYAEANRLPGLDAGQYLFRTRCAACHTFGQGDGLGPDLLGVTGRRDRAWLARWLADPPRMLAERDPVAAELLARYGNVPMPNLRLGQDDIAALMEYMEARSVEPGRGGK